MQVLGGGECTDRNEPSTSGIPPGWLHSGCNHGNDPSKMCASTY